MPIESKNLPASTIGGTPKIAGPATRKSAEPMVHVRNPKTGEVAEVSQQNGRDMTRLNGWVYHAASNEVPAADAQGTEELEVVSERNPQDEETTAEQAEVVEQKETDPSKMNPLDKLRYDYKTLTGEEPDMRWGKKKLDELIEAATAPSPSEPENVDAE